MKTIGNTLNVLFRDLNQSVTVLEMQASAPGQIISPWVSDGALLFVNAAGAQCCQVG